MYDSPLPWSIFVFLENPKNCLVGYSYPPGDASQFQCFLISFEELLGGEALYRQATQTCNPVSGFLDELPGGDEHSLGDGSQIDSILMFCAFWGDFDRGKRKSYVIINDVMCYIVELRMVRGSIR